MSRSGSLADAKVAENDVKELLDVDFPHHAAHTSTRLSKGRDVMHAKTQQQAADIYREC
jgi:hypothetical protein